jgi:hypothetical protein
MSNPPGTVVVSARRRGSIVVYVFVAILLAGMAASLAAQPTMSGKITSVVFFGLFIALCIGVWLLAEQSRDRIEVTPTVITYRHGGQRGTSLTLRKNQEQGAQLRLITPRTDEGLRGIRLAIVDSGADGYDVGGAGHEIGLFRFNAQAVKRACESAGWQFAPN